MTEVTNEPNGAHSSPPPTNRDITHLLKSRTVCQKTTLGHAKLWRKVSEGTFPEPIKIGNGRVGWCLEEVEEWLKNQKIKPNSE